MEIRDFLSEVKTVFESDPRLAISLLASDLSLFVEASHGAKARRSDAIHRKIVSHTTHLYKGVSPKLADVGHAAFRAGLHASQMHNSKTADAKLKAQAHDDAHDSHMTAAEKLRRAGHEHPAIFHMAAADTHMQKKAELKKTKSEGVGDDMRNVQSNKQAVAQKMQKLKSTMKARSARPITKPATIPTTV